MRPCLECMRSPTWDELSMVDNCKPVAAHELLIVFDKQYTP